MNAKFTVAELAKMLDHTLLNNHISNLELKAHCDLAKQYGFKTVAINNAAIDFCAKELKGTDVLVDAAISFPFGQCTIDTKVFETIDAIAKGAGEVDYVVNLVEIKNGNWEYIENEMSQIVGACKQRNTVSKVIFETCFLTEQEKVKLCEVALKVKPTFVKTSTGYGTAGATVEDVKLMKSIVQDKIKVKASGGVRTIEDALAMIEAGASRIGTSKSCDIIEGYKKYCKGV